MPASAPPQPVRRRARTIRDIAKVAGIHFTTVALALRDDPRVAQATRERVKRIAEQMHYRPNPLVTALMTSVRAGRARSRPLVLAFCTYWDSREGWKEVATHRMFYEGAKNQAEALGYRLDHFNLREKGYSPKRWSDILTNRGIRGLILASFQTLVQDFPLDWQNFAAVRIDPNPKNPHLDTVCSHQMQIMRVAYRQAVARGYRRIGMAVHRFWDERLGDPFLAGFLTEQSAQGGGCVSPFRTYDWNEGPFLRWFRAEKPDVIIALGLGNVLTWLKKERIKRPGRIGFIDLDQSDLEGAVAGMRKNHPLLGATAVDMVVGKIQRNEAGIPEFPTLTLVGGRWIDGASVAPLPANAPDPSVSLG